MISYKPSVGQRNGNATQVAAREDNTLYGESVGGVILPFTYAPVEHKLPINTDLTNTSTWFYKQFTDYNFINGVDVYRAIYIGVDPKSTEQEIIGTIDTEVTNNFTSAVSADQTLVDSSVSTQIWLEGKFNFAKGVLDKGGLVLQDETDSTNVLDSQAVWTSSVVANQTLIPGEYLKFWIKMSSVQNERMLNFDDFIYTIRIGGLSIPVNKERGRLNVSSVYSVNLDKPTLNQVDFNLRESLPNGFDLQTVVKIIQNNENMTVFYFDSNSELNVLTVKVDFDITKNKYVASNLYDITGDIKVLETFTYSNFSKCITMGSSGTSGVGTSGVGTSGVGTTGTTGTTGVGTTGTTGVSGNPAVDELLGNKFIVNIFGSKKDLNIFYILYNEFVTENGDDYIARYGHQQYSWNTGVIKIDLRNVNNPLFDQIEPGDTFNMVLFNACNTFQMQARHFWNSAVFIDDLFIMVGFDVEDCRLTNNRTFLTYIWEKDIILNTPKYQQTNIPKSDTNFLKTVKNKAHTDAVLIMEFIDQIDLENNFYNRSVSEFNNGVSFVKMGPPHKTQIEHDYTEITYDIALRVDEFSSTWSFGIDPTNSFVISAPATGSPGTTGTTGVGTTGTTGTTGSPIQPIPPDIDSPYFLHMLYQEDYNDYIQNPYPLIDPFERDYKDTFISLFKLNCNDNEQNAVVTVEYNFHQQLWKITTEDKGGTWVRNFVDDGPLVSLDFDNVFTIDTYRKQVYGCGKKYMLDFNLYFNGLPLFSGITFTDSTTDTYVITYNHEEEFTGHLSYMEVKKGGLNDSGINYALTMYQILSNIAWPELESENRNEISAPGLEFYTFKRNILINNLNWNNTDDFLFPVVLQGNSYNVDDIYNSEIRRSIFDFGKIDVNGPSFAFAFEGTSNQLEWFAEKYDFNNDIMVVWIRMQDWRGQRITMYYSDIRVIRDFESTKAFSDYYGVWYMEKFVNETQMRFITSNIYDGGEAIVVAENDNGIFTLELDKQYFFGNAKIYKSSTFDILYDDREIHRGREQSIENFIRDSVELFKPGNIELRNVGSLYPIKIEADGYDSAEVIVNE